MPVAADDDEDPDVSCVGIVEVVVAAADEWPKMSVVQEGRSCSLPSLFSRILVGR